MVPIPRREHTTSTILTTVTSFLQRSTRKPLQPTHSAPTPVLSSLSLERRRDPIRLASARLREIDLKRIGPPSTKPRETRILHQRGINTTPIPIGLAPVLEIDRTDLTRSLPVRSVSNYSLASIESDGWLTLPQFQTRQSRPACTWCRARRA